MLELINVTAGYGDVTVLREVSLRVEDGEVVALIGANGAGKTTLMRAVSRLIAVSAGAIALGGEDITRAHSKRVAALGAAHVPEGRKLWPEMSVEDNLILGAYPARAKARREENLERVYSLFPRVRERRKQLAGTLSGGEQQMVAISRGLMLSPEILMLDEPSLGLAPIIVEELFNAIAQINSQGTSVLLVEQNVKQALEAAARGYVLETGRIVSSGTSAELLADASVQSAYLGL